MNYGNMNFSNSIFTGDLDKDGTIYSIGQGRERIKVGIDSQREQDLIQSLTEMQETLDNWRPKMIEHGYIQIQKSPEEIAREAADEQFRIMQEQADRQAEINQSLLKTNQALFGAIENLSAELKELKASERSEYGIGLGDKETGSNSESNGKVPGSNKVSTSTRKKASS